jgi:hypothetical protein
MFSLRNSVLVAVFPACLFFSVWIFEGQPNIQIVVGSVLLSLYGILALVDQFNWWRRNKPSNVYVYVVLEDAPLAFPTEFAKEVHRLMTFQEGPRKRHKSGGYWLKRKKGYVWRSW